MPQLDPTSYPSQLFWLAITFGILWVFVRNYAAPRLDAIATSRKKSVASDLDAAETARAEATGLEERHRSEIAEAHAKAREEIARSQVAAQGKSSERTAELGKTLAKRIADAEERVEQAKREALAEIETVAADAARDIVRRVAGIDVAEKDARAALAGARS